MPGLASLCTLVKTCLLATLITTAPAQQGAPLPSEMVSGVWHDFADLVFPHTDPAYADRLWAEVSFDTEDQTVTFNWTFQADGAQYGKDTTVHTLGFQPTALCTKTGIGPELFVAGYSERTGSVLVEQWTVDDMLLAGTVLPSGAPGPSTFSRTIRKELILTTTTIQPLRTIAYHKTQERLWLIEEAPPHVTWQLDPVTGFYSHFFDSTVVPQLSLALFADAVMVDQGLPDGGGFLILLLPWRAWKLWPGQSANHDDTDVYVFRDHDLDGVIDESVQMTWGEYESRGYSAYSDPLYP